MWKLLLLAVFANSFFLSLGFDDSESEESNESGYQKITYYYNKEDGSEEDSEKNENEENKDTDYEKNKKIDYEGNKVDYPKRTNDNYYKSNENYNDDKYYKGDNENYYKGNKYDYYKRNNEDYNEKESIYFPKRWSKKHSGSCPPYDDEYVARCSNALHNFNDGVLTAGLQLFKKYVDSSPSEPGAINPLATLYQLASLAIFGVGQTAAEIYSLLNLSNRQEIECVFYILNKVFDNLPCGVVLDGTSDVFGNEQFQFTDEFKNVVYNIISGAAVNVDFSNSELAVDVVNGQAKLETSSRVDNLILDSSIFNRSTELVAISGTYFTSPWEIEFKLSKEIKEFIVGPGKRVPGRFYTQTAVYEYAHSSELHAQAVRLKYKDNILNLLVIVPDEAFTEYEVLDRMLEDPTGWYKRLSRELKPTKVDVTIPAYIQETYVDTRALLMEGTGVTTIYNAETIQLKGVIKGDIPAGVSIGFQKHTIQIPSDGYPPKKNPPGEAVEFLANIPHFWFVCISSTETPVYIGYTNAPTTGAYK